MQPAKLSDAEILQAGQGSIQKLKALYQNQKWEKVSDKPCLMFKMEIDDRLAARGEATVPFSIDEVFEFIGEDQSLAKLNDQLKSIKKLYETQEHLEERHAKIVHQHYKAIWPVHDRDFVTVVFYSKEGDVYYCSAQSIAYDFPQQKGVVRARINVGGYILKKIDEKTTHVTYVSDSDLCGSIPGMIKKEISKKQGTVASKIQEAMKKK